MEVILNQSLYSLSLYFIVYAFVGWCMESSFKSLLYKKCINSGFLNGPFIPIYGIGAIFIIMFLTPFKSEPKMVFLLGFIFLTLIEYITGVIMEKMFNTRWWDYTGNFMNIGGKICVENSIYWGILAVILVNYLHPKITEIIMSLPVIVGKLFLILFFTYFIIDFIVTLVEVLELQEKVKIFVKIKDNAIVLATTSKVTELKESIVNNSSRLLNTYPKLTYIKINRKLRDIVNEIKK